MNRHTSFNRRPLSLAIIAALAASGFSVPVQAVTRAWDGGGANDNWSFMQALTFNTNWVGPLSLPGSDDTLVFAGSNRLTPYNDFSNLSINGLLFDEGAGAFVLGGNGITSTGNIDNISHNLQTINMAIKLGTSQTWDGGSAGMTVNGRLRLGNNALTVQNLITLNFGNTDFEVDNASLALKSGSQLNNRTTIVGNNGIGGISITGAGSRWTSSGGMYIGNLGNGTLTIDNGGQVFDQYAYLGDFGTGTAKVAGANSQWNNSDGLYVGHYASGTLTIEQGGQVSNSGGYLGYYSGSTGNATVTGANSQWINRNDLYLGHIGNGTLVIEQGGQVSNSNGYLGYFFGSTGNATVRGTNSQWKNGDNLYVGYAGNGTLTIEMGGQVSNSSGYLGYDYGTGNANVSGANSLWTNRNALYVGYLGSGTLTVEKGGQVENTDAYLGVNGGTGNATVSGAESRWTTSNNLYVGYGGNSTLTIEKGGQVNSTNGYLSTFNTSKVNVTVTGANSKWSNKNDFIVGGASQVTLDIENGGQVDNNEGILGLNLSSIGYAAVSGANSQWINRGDLYVGKEGYGTLSINNGGTVSVGGNLRIGAYGLLDLNGGVLAAGSSDVLQGGVFNWRSGTVNLASATIGGGGLFGDSLQLTASRVLNVRGNAYVMEGAFANVSGTHFTVGGDFANDGMMGVNADGHLTVGNQFSNTGSIINRGVFKIATLNNSGNLRLAGTGLVVANHFNLQGGSVTGDALNMDTVNTLSGYGSVVSAITGGSAANTIQASGGNLALGDVNSTAGFDFGGNLIIGAKQINLLDKDQANLGISTTLSNGGRLNAANGSVLGNGDTLIYTGSASILGNFTNNGEVSGSGGELTFLNDVNGAGRFAGDIVFHAAYNPGNSPAAVDFNGGNTTYDASSVLTMEILGSTPGSQYDQLLNIDHLIFNGMLNLVFGPGFSPTKGESFALFDFNSFSGSLATDRITVTGLDRSLLDFNQLASNGRLQIAAVPLPAGIWLFVSGLATLALGSRRVG